MIITEGAKPGTKIEISFPVEITDRYNLNFYLLKGPMMGLVKILPGNQLKESKIKEFISPAFNGYSLEKELGLLSLTDILLPAGQNCFWLEAVGKEEAAQGMEMAFIGLSLRPAARKFIREWNILGPFDAPDLECLHKIYPPEEEIDLEKKYIGKGGESITWIPVKAEESGYIRLETLFKHNEQTVAYGLVYIFSPEKFESAILLGSDDAVRVWLNDVLIHSNATYRGAWPDQDKINVTLQAGWNKLLVKVLQGAGGWGFYLRLADPEDKLRFSLRPEKEK